MTEPYITPYTKPWYSMMRKIAIIGGEDKADEWAFENEERYDRYNRCAYCEYYIGGECRNLDSDLAYEDVRPDDVCDKYEWCEEKDDE